MDILRQAASRVRGRDHGGDPESATASSRQPPLPPPPPVVDAHRRGTVIPADDSLATFRFLVGIMANSAMGSPYNFTGRPAPNVGIYERVVKNEANSKKQFKIFSILISSCLGLQIIVAAALTALGAAKSSYNTITVFGAINTVIAGFLTYLKGSGLPNRMRYYANEWGKLRHYIEQRERDFSRQGCTLDPYRVVEEVEHMFEEIKADVEANTPDSFVSVTDMRSRRQPGQTNPQPTGESTSYTTSGTASGSVPGGGGGFADKLKELEAKYGDKVRHIVEEVEQKAKDYAHGSEAKAKEVQRDIGEYEQRVLDEKSAEASTEVREFAQQRANEFDRELAARTTDPFARDHRAPSPKDTTL